MIRNNIKSKKGFTIIEVVLVLAIAGLIFLMVFIAFPALQRGQRDTQRREDMGRFGSQLAQYQANNYGRVPGDATAWNDEFIAKYLKTGGDTFADPSGKDYTVVEVEECEVEEGSKVDGASCKQKSVETDTADAYIRLYTNATCSGETPQYKRGAKYIAFTYKLEGAGIYCGHN